MKRYSKKSKNTRAKRWWRERLELQKTDNLFTTHQVLEGIEFQWADFYFIGKKPDVYAATISTAKFQYAEDLFYPAWDLAEELVPSPGCNFDWMDPNNVEKDLVEGIPRHDWITNKEKELADAGAHPTYEQAIIKDWYYSWGLHIVVNKPTLTVDDLNEFIANWDFKSYRSPEPLTFKAKDLYWGLECREIKDPENWYNDSLVELGLKDR